MKKFTTRETSLVVLPVNEPLTSNSAITVSIVDNDDTIESVIVEQEGNILHVTVDNWASLRDAIEKLINQCRLVKRENDVL